MSSFNSFHGYKADAGGFANGVLQVSKTPWSEFFGEARYAGSSPEYDPISKETWTLPDAYLGKNVKIRQEVEFLVYSDQSFYSRVMPLKIIEGTNKFSWYTTEYATQRPDLVPELGVSRLLGHRKTGRTATMERRGLSIFFEHGFMHTEEGRQTYVDTLKQLALSIIEFSKFDIIHTLLTAWNLGARSERRHGFYVNRRVAEIFDDQLEMWACLQKTKNALVKLNTRVTNTMARWRGTADTWIMAPEIQAYQTTTPSERTDYYLAGPAGPQMLQDAPTAAMRVGNKDVYYARTYDIDEDGPVDILQAHAQIGEYDEMRDRERDTNYAGYTSKNRHVRIYNEDADAWFECTLKWALDASMRFNPATGELIDPAAAGAFNPVADELGRAGDEDVFRFFDEDTQRMQTTRLFGQIEERYFPAADKLNLARTAIAALRERWGATSAQNFDKAWQDGIALVDRIDALGYSPALEAAAAAAGGDPVADLIAAELGPNAGTTLHAGLQSYAGFKKIAANGQEPEKKVAADFIVAFDALVAALSDILPGSYILDPRFASPSWGKSATAADVLFENAIARARVPLFYMGAAAKLVPTDVYEAVYTAQKAAQATRITKNGDGGGELIVPNALPASPAGRDVAIAAAALLSSVSTAKDDPNASKIWYDQASEEIRRLVGSNWEVPRISRQTLVERVLALGAPFGRPETARKRIDSIFNSQLVGEPSGQPSGSFGAGSTRTALLAGPALVRDIADRIKAGTPVAVLPASPSDPRVPIKKGELLRLAARFDQYNGRGESGDDYAAADAPASGAVPAFEGFIASDLSRHIEHIAMHVNNVGADAVSGSDAYLGDEMDDAYDSGAPLPRAVPRGRAPGEALDETKTASMRRAWRNVRRVAGGDRLLALVAHAYDFTPVRLEPLHRMIQKNVVLPLAFVVARPHASYVTAQAICCLSGEAMGMYAYQHGTFMVGDDADVQAHTGSYTYKSKAVVTNEDHVYVARNVFVTGCLGGLGVELFDPETYGLGDPHTGGASIFVLCVPYASNEAGGAPISLTGNVTVNGKAYNLGQRDRLDYVGVSYYNSIWGWRQNAQDTYSDGISVLDEVAERTFRNTIMFRGTSQLYNPMTRDFTVLQRGKGHWGAETTYPGCRNVRNGAHAEFDKIRGSHPGMSEA